MLPRVTVALGGGHTCPLTPTLGLAIGATQSGVPVYVAASTSPTKMLTVMVWSSNCERSALAVSVAPGPTVSSGGTCVPLTSAVTVTGSCPLLVTVRVPCGTSPSHTSSAPRSTSGGGAAQSTVSTSLVMTSPPGGTAPRP